MTKTSRASPLRNFLSIALNGDGTLVEVICGIVKSAKLDHEEVVGSACFKLMDAIAAARAENPEARSVIQALPDGEKAGNIAFQVLVGGRPDVISIPLSILWPH